MMDGQQRKERIFFSIKHGCVINSLRIIFPSNRSNYWYSINISCARISPFFALDLAFNSSKHKLETCTMHTLRRVYRFLQCSRLAFVYTLSLGSFLFSSVTSISPELVDVGGFSFFQTCPNKFSQFFLWRYKLIADMRRFWTLRLVYWFEWLRPTKVLLIPYIFAPFTGYWKNVEGIYRFELLCIIDFERQWILIFFIANRCRCMEHTKKRRRKILQKNWARRRRGSCDAYVKRHCIFVDALLLSILASTKIKNKIW